MTKYYCVILSLPALSFVAVDGFVAAVTIDVAVAVDAANNSGNNSSTFRSIMLLSNNKLANKEAIKLSFLN